MGKKLVVAEKPSVARDIANVLGCNNRQDGYIEGPDYIVTWAVGHLVGLKYPEEHDEQYKKWTLEDLPLVFPIEKSLKVLPKTKKQFKVIKDLIHRSDVDGIINAGDAGREGYLIQKWIYRMAGNKKPEQVLWASSMTEEAIKKHMSNLKDDALFSNLLYEAEARAEGDNILGINYSRLLTLTKGNGKNVLSYGRCQTPLLNQIVLRDEEIENFVSKPYYNVESVFDKGYKGLLIDDKREKINFDNKKDAEDITKKVKNKNGIIKEYIEQLKTKKAPLLYNLAGLQKAMGSKYGYTPDKTLSIAQSLYETHKILSYPRTDSQCLSTDLYNEITRHLDSCNFGKFKTFLDKIDYSNMKADTRYFNDLKVTDHHALIPTINSNTKNIYDKLTQEEKNVFDCVANSLIAIFFPDYEYTSIDVITEVEGYLFASKGIKVNKLGYKEILGNEKEEKKEEEDIQTIPKLNQNESVYCEDSIVLDKMTKPLARFTTNSLIALMEKYNIGTSATRAEIIKKLQTRDFVKYQKGKYISTELGRNFIKIIPDDLKDVKLTANFEEQLSLINDGKLQKNIFLKEIVDDFKDNQKKIKNERGTLNMNNVLATCPCCGGDVTENSKAYGCSNYKDGCEFVIWKNISGKNITENIALDLINNGEVKKMKGFKNKAGKSYEAGLKLTDDGLSKNGKYPVKKIELVFENNSEDEIISSIKCPCCSGNIISSKWAYKCDSCDFSISKKICSREISKNEAIQIINKGKSDKLDGFVSKAGKNFSAYLVYEDGKVNFSFE